MFDCYLRIEVLPCEVKKRHKIKAESSIPRLDVTAQAGYYKPLEALKNDKGIIYFNLIETRGYINSTDIRRADVRLQCRDNIGKQSVNFSSIYLLDLNTENIIAYGNPPSAKTLKTGKQNPFFENREDGFLFLAKKDFSEIEILIVPNGKYIIQGLAKEISDGKMNDILKNLRSHAKPIFNYV